MPSRSEMAFKVYYGQEIHRFAKLPDSFKAMIQSITSKFTSPLPLMWNIYYLDLENDRVALSDEEDYMELIKAQESNPSTVTKLYIVPVQASEDHFSQVNEERSYELITDVERAQLADSKLLGSLKDSDKLLDYQIQSDELISQNNREKTAFADIKVIQPDQLNNEVYPQAIPQPQDEGNMDSTFSLKSGQLLRKSRRSNVEPADILEEEKSSREDAFEEDGTSTCHTNRELKKEPIKLFKAMVKAYNKEEAEEVNEYRQALVKVEEVTPIIETLFEQLSKCETNKAVKDCMINAELQLKQFTENQKMSKSKNKRGKDQSRKREKSQNQTLQLQSVATYRELMNAHKNNDSTQVEICLSKLRNEVPELKLLLNPTTAVVPKNEEREKYMLNLHEVKSRLKQNYSSKDSTRPLSSRRHKKNEVHEMLGEGSMNNC